jgi:type IV conjugative transfer system protein TraL
MEPEQYRILNYLDSPLKILLWSRNELLSYGVPFLVGVCSSQTLLGFSISVLNFMILKRAKRGVLEWWDGFLYWHLPRGRLFAGFPPSYARHLVG